MYTTGIEAPHSSKADLILVEEISHRVCNQYSQAVAGIRLAARAAADEQGRAALLAVADQLLWFAQAHRALHAPASPEWTNPSHQLEAWCAAMNAAMLTARGVHLTVTSESLMLPAWSCWRIALIAAELITNSVRHGLRNGPGKIKLRLVQQGDRALLEVIDDGGGDPSRSTGRGTAIVSALADELRGELGWSFGSEGTAARLLFPLQPSAVAA